jgi:hypothetical protein
MPLNQLVCEITDFIENIISIIVKKSDLFLDEIRVIFAKNLGVPLKSGRAFTTRFF